MYHKRKKSKICVFYHIPERELDSCLMIAEAVKKINPNAEVIVEEFYKGICPALLYKPDVILTIPPRDIHTAYRLTIVKKILNCAVLSLMTEGFYQSFSEYDIQISIGTHRYSPKLIDKYLFWGEKTKESFLYILKKDGKITDDSRAQVVGYTYYDMEAFEEHFKGKELPPTFMKWKQRYEKIILILTGFSFADDTKTEQIIMSAFKYYGVKGKEKEYEQEVQEWQKRRNIFIDYREKYLNCAIRFAENHPDIGILVKLHPVELKNFINGKKGQCYRRLEKYDNIHLLRESILLGRILPLVDTMVHYGSTSGLEAYIYKIPIVLLYDPNHTEQIGMPGFCIYESTAKIDINDTELFDKMVYEGVEPRYLESIEKVLKEQFNWKKNKKDQYHPTKTYAEIILDSVSNGQEIEDNSYKFALQSVIGYDMKHYFIKRMIKMMFIKRKKEVVKCQKILDELGVHISFFECTMIELRVMFDKVKRKIFKKYEIQ